MDFLIDNAPSLAILASFLALAFPFIRSMIRFQNEMRAEFKELRSDVSWIKSKIEYFDTEISNVKTQLNDARGASKEEHQKLHASIEDLSEKVYVLNGEMKKVLGHLFGVSDPI